MKKTVLACICSSLLMGCAFGGGSTEPDIVPSSSQSTTNNQATSENKITYKTPTIAVEEDNAEVGYTINAPIPKNLLRKSDDLFAIHTLNSDAQYLETADNANQTSIKIRFTTVQTVNGEKQYVIEERDIPISISNDGWDYLTNSQKYEDGKAVYYYEDGDPSFIIKLFTTNNTLLGMAQIPVDGFVNGSLLEQKPYYVTSIFYKGFDKTSVNDIPEQGKFIYEGYWLFSHQLKGDDDNSPLGGTGELTAQDKVQFTVDFTQKTLTGKLKTSSKVDIDYDIKADIKGRNFYGTASGSYSDKTNNLGDKKNGQSNAEAVVFGSFYGKQAEDLAGRAMATDNSWAGVFAATKNNQDISELYAAGVLKFNDSQLDGFEKIAFDGDIKTLIVDGTQITLVENTDTCCSEMQFAQYGLYHQQVNGKTQGGYFVQGTPTANYDMPTTGTAEYAGYWYGNGTGIGNVTAKKLDARFTADWQNKTLAGNLYAQNQQISSDNPAVKFNANIQNNQFIGDASLNWSIDSSKEGLGNDSAIVGQAKVQGMFYGPSANELSGHFLSEDKNVGGVFGGKQIDN